MWVRVRAQKKGVGSCSWQGEERLKKESCQSLWQALGRNWSSGREKTTGYEGFTFYGESKTRVSSGDGRICRRPGVRQLGGWSYWQQTVISAEQPKGKVVREQGRFNHPNCLKSPHNFSSLSLQNKIGKIQLKLHR